MTADPYLTIDDWKADLESMGEAQTCAGEAYGDQYDRMDAILAEGLPWPGSPHRWDTNEEIAKMLASWLYDGEYGWGVLIVADGPRHERHIRLMVDRLLASIFGEPSRCVRRSREM